MPKRQSAELSHPSVPYAWGIENCATEEASKANGAQNGIVVSRTGLWVLRFKSPPVVYVSAISPSTRHWVAHRLPMLAVLAAWPMRCAETPHAITDCALLKVPAVQACGARCALDPQCSTSRCNLNADADFVCVDAGFVLQWFSVGAAPLLICCRPRTFSLQTLARFVSRTPDERAMCSL